VLFKGLAPLEGILHRLSLVGDKPVFDLDDFPWTRKLEDNWLDIRRDLDRVLRCESVIPGYVELSEEARNLTDAASWKSFFFHAYGVEAPGARDLCPATAALLSGIPGMKSAFFSILKPGAHLPPHRGHWAGILRYHLGLKIPDEALCGLRVSDQILHWREGRGLIFDDTFEHEAWNRSEGDRVVLFVDFARPLPGPAARLNAFAIWLVSRSSVIQPGIARLKALETRLQAAWRQAAVDERSG